jgi:hypothetical protein
MHAHTYARTYARVQRVYPDLPAPVYLDWGQPVDGSCAETGPGSGVFTRRWQGGTVALDCNTWTPSFNATL